MSVDLYCVMGNPIAHSQSPWIHARFAELTGQRLEYTRRLIELDGFAQGVRGFMADGGRGCNITLPFKFEAAALADAVSPRGQLAGACNTLKFDDGRIFADNTDGIGLVDDITQNADFQIKGKRVLLVGAGGAAAGVLGPLLEAHPQHLTVANRTLDKAQALVQRHLGLAQQNQVDLQARCLKTVHAPFDLVINGTATSLGGHGVPVDAHVLKPGALAYDMMYGAGAQNFQHWAQRHGAVARDGLGMLVGQAAESYLLWRGIMPPARQVLDELRQRLEVKAA